MKILFTLLCILFTATLFPQSTISGKVTDPKGKPVSGANVFIDGTYDGTTTDVDGGFSFTTSETGLQTLVITSLHFDEFRMQVDVSAFQNQVLKLREDVNTLDAVIVTAGTFEAGDRACVSVLKPLDIVTTAGSSGDIVAALQTLPGTQTVGEDGRLFVRGGEADETQTYVDGVRVAQPYSATASNLPTRGRFSPFLFKGISFSTGGYSAEYGEALSSVLLLSTEDEPAIGRTDIALMTVGLGLGHTQKWEKQSLSLNAAYTDLAPYQAAVPENIDWHRPYQSLAGELAYRYRFVSGLLKIYTAFDATRFDLNQQSINSGVTRIDSNNNNLYLNSSYKGSFGNAWQLETGLSYGYNNNKVALNRDDAENSEKAIHLKLKFRKTFSQRLKLSFGADYFNTSYDDHYSEHEGSDYYSGFKSGITTAYSEADIYFSKKFAAKIGVRASHNSLFDETAVSPRISLAYKIASQSQFSFAYGEFEQSPRHEYLRFSNMQDFSNERATHFILNYQYAREKQTFRMEAYHKKYDKLVTFDSETGEFDSEFSDEGNGFAKGLDVFWRDGKSFKSLEYWISYSYIDTERKYRNFPTSVTPSFVADHQLSIVTKYWINSWRSQIGFTNTFSTGRPYDNPNQSQFMSAKTKSYNNLSFSWAYLLGPQKILYFSISNVLGTKNVYGYEYSNTSDVNGDFDRRAITPTADRFFFVGFFWTISDDKKINQLENL